MDEARLVEDALLGNLDAFNDLVLAYQDMAFNLAYRMLDDDAAAQDATQTAFVSAYRNLKSYRGGSFRAWVLRMVTNTCYDELRRRHRRPTVPLEPFNPEDDETIESPAWIADDDPSPESRAESRELENAITHCIQELPEDFRAVVIMVDVQGMDYAEVSLAMGKPLGTVKSRLARARVRLRVCLGSMRELLPGQFRLGEEEIIS